MATELTDEDRALLEQCISKALGPRIKASELIPTLPDPGETLRLIKADEEAACEYLRRRYDLSA